MISLEQLAQGFEDLADEVAEPRDLLLDWRQRKNSRLDNYWSEIHKIKFAPASIGRFSPGRGKVIEEGDRYGFATGTTRRETTRAFSIESTGTGMVLEMGPTNDWAKYFNITLIKKGIPAFSQGILPLDDDDIKDAEDLAGEYLISTADEVL